jgi:chloramphenicol 3-O phosphotransferase
VKNTIIYLNGPSSVGKSTIALALQERLPDPYLYTSIDTLIGLMPARMNDWTGERTTPGFSFVKATDPAGHEVYRVAAGPYGQRISRAFREMVLALARCDLDLIIDDIAFGAEQVDSWRACLRGFTVLWVGITASVETLEAREQARGDRLPGSARDQHSRVHTGVTYDLFLDTTHLSPDEAVSQILTVLPAKNA